MYIYRILYNLEAENTWGNDIFNCSSGCRTRLTDSMCPSRFDNVVAIISYHLSYLRLENSAVEEIITKSTFFYFDVPKAY